MANFEKDYYKTLGVTEKATAKEIRTAYHKLAKKLHPDRNPGDKESERKFKEVNEAYETLSDPKKRPQYDQIRELSKHGFRFQPGGQGAGAGGFDFSQFANLGGEGGPGSLSDVFDMLFNREARSGTAAAAGGPARGGEDIRATAQVPIGVAARGGSIALSVEAPGTCPACNGTGGARPTSCPQCRGSGKSSGLRGRPCVRCGGSGQVPSSACQTCGGRGETLQGKRLNVKIPPETKEGTEMRLAGQGAAGPGGPGDLYIQVKLVSDGSFRMEGEDVATTTKVGVFQLILGTSAEVTTPKGEKLRLKIPAGTQPGTRLRLRGKGLSGHDLYVEIQGVLPVRISPAAREELEKLAAELGD